MIESVIIAVISAMVYSLSVYFRKNEPFDYVKFGTTAVVGGLAGAVMSLFGVPINEESVGLQVLGYAGLAAIVENLLKKLKQWLETGIQ